MLDTLEGIRTAWDRIAPGYARHVTPTHLSLAAEGLQRAGVTRGTAFLDVAAGSGALSLPAARLGAQVLATDLSPVMLRELEQRARADGLTNLQTRAMDGHALELDDASFDVAGSQFGVMLFPDMPRGIRELARVTRPGGRVLMIVFGDPREVGFIRFLVRALRSVAPNFALPDPPPLPFQLRDPARLQRELQAAGLGPVRVDTLTEQLEFSAGGELWDWLVSSNPIVTMLLAQLKLTQPQIAEVRASLDEQVGELAAGRGKAVLTNAINIGVGLKR